MKKKMDYRARGILTAFILDKEGHAYNVYLSSNGNAFINKVSKKSGRKYRKYLPEVTKMIQNQGK